jgi:MoaA/NifB/PqqE/SkfB family radical SAM enzyme
MDLRIVNTCNNNCLYCLEQELRDKKQYLSLDFLLPKITENKENNITFYWWNPLLHPDLTQIIKESSKNWKSNIWILSNTWNLHKELIEKLINNGLNNFWFYFYSFQENIHDLYSWWNLNLRSLCSHIKLIQQYNIHTKAVIHLNKWNIQNISHDIEVLHNNFWVKTFEIINYLIVDRAVKYSKLLEYNISTNRENIDKLFNKIKQLNIQVKFVRFNKDFYWKYQNFNDNKQWKQI